MIEVGLLLLWMATGAASAALGPNSGWSRTAWIPMAVILGPLWLAVRAELEPPEPAWLGPLGTTGRSPARPLGRGFEGSS